GGGAGLDGARTAPSPTAAPAPATPPGLPRGAPMPRPRPRGPPPAVSPAGRPPAAAPAGRPAAVSLAGRPPALMSSAVIARLPPVSRRGLGAQLDHLPAAARGPRQAAVSRRAHHDPGAIAPGQVG